MGLLTAFLTVLILSQIAIATGRNAPRGNKELAETRSSTISRFLRWDAVRDTGDVRSSSSRQPGEASSARVRGLAVWRDKGAWEQWNKWDSLERHVIAAVMVGASPLGLGLTSHRLRNNPAMFIHQLSCFMLLLPAHSGGFKFRRRDHIQDIFPSSNYIFILRRVFGFSPCYPHSSAVYHPHKYCCLSRVSIWVRGYHTMMSSPSI